MDRARCMFLSLPELLERAYGCPVECYHSPRGRLFVPGGPDLPLA